MRFDKLAEHQIQKAKAQGQLDDLKGAGKPLSARADTGAEGVGMGMMAQEGVLPREFELRKEAEALRAELRDTTDEAARKPLLKRLADVEMRRAIEEEARRKFMRHR